MHTIGVAGAGTMGAGIAQVAASAGLDVVLYDSSREALERARGRIALALKTAVEKNKLGVDQAAAAAERIRYASSVDAFGTCEAAIEAIIEDRSAKQELLNELAGRCLPGAMLATNTSSIPVTSIASAVPDPGRVVGMHFFNPPHIMPLVEIISGNRTESAIRDKARALAVLLGKTPVHVRDTPGFIVNRCARPFYGEALRIIAEGVAAPEEVDRIVRSGGFRMGPFELMDLIGIDVNLAVTRSMYEQTFGEPRYRPHPIQQQMVDAGLLGRKTGRGFYSYKK